MSIIVAVEPVDGGAPRMAWAALWAAEWGTTANVAAAIQSCRKIHGDNPPACADAVLCAIAHHWAMFGLETCALMSGIQESMGSEVFDIHDEDWRAAQMHVLSYIDDGEGLFVVQSGPEDLTLYRCVAPEYEPRPVDVDSEADEEMYRAWCRAWKRGGLSVDPVWASGPDGGTVQ